MDIHERLTRVETKVDDILGNHLPSLDKKIDNVVDNLNRLLYIIITGLVSIIGLLIKLVLK